MGLDLARLRANLDDVRRRIEAACRRAGRSAEQITLVVVTKTIPGEQISRLPEAGVTDVAENRPVEAGGRRAGIRGLRRHMIGHLQTNKVRKALGWADVLHSVDRAALAEALAKAGAAIPCYVQVNVSGEASKGGFRPEELGEALRMCRASLKVEGLMTMAPQGEDPRPHFRRLRGLAEAEGLRGLSMGMSQDFEAAVEEGATAVRIGSAIFEGTQV
jgi:pyridoxal phosphate enzyme (YggS family)